jgi:uncharacterized protein YeaO (DUF488 family)
MVRIKRAYESAEREDGYRVLVDRIWPRGVTKEAARLDQWAKELAPSTGLRTWFGHNPVRFREFAERYRLELEKSPAREVFMELLQHAAHGRVTLVYGARDEEHNNAVVLKREIENALGYGASPQ